MTPARRGWFFVFEGIDGSGKSTVVATVAEELAARGFDVLKTFEPTNSEWGQKIRRIAAEGRAGISPAEEARYFIEDRKLHVEGEIKPALAGGKIVLCDRYFYSTMAYQGALGLDVGAIRAVNEREYRFPIPDRVFLLDISLDAALERIARNRRGGANAGYEKREFLSRVKAIFDAMADSNFARVDASRPPEKMAGEILEGILSEI